MSPFTRPQVGSYDAMNAASTPASYWLSPSVMTPARFEPTSSLDVYSIRHTVALPRRLWNPPSAGSQAMSPAAAMTGSPPDGAVVVVVVVLVVVVLVVVVLVVVVVVVVVV